MGKGDIRSRRGKIWRGTYGVTRPQKTKSVGAASAKAVASDEKKAAKTAKKKKQDA